MPDDAERLLSVAYAAFRLALNNTPFCNAMYRAMKDPNPGDLVLEVSAGARMELRGLGYLVTDVGDDADGGVIRCLDGTEQRWDNAQFVRVPTDALVREIDAAFRAAREKDRA